MSRIIARALDNALGGGRPVPTSGRSRATGDWQTDLRQIVAEAGGIRPAGRAVGVAESTLRGWLKSPTPPSAKARKFVTDRLTVGVNVLRLLILDRGMADKIRNNTVTLHTLELSDNERWLEDRNVEFVSGVGESIVNAWLSGDSMGAARRFRAWIGEQVFYHPHYFGDWFMRDANITHLERRSPDGMVIGRGNPHSDYVVIGLVFE